jgi:2-oxoglutarate ferredoxin oxidoreductase subunit beta
MDSQQEVKTVLTPKDYQSDVDVRWCPGCGDYAILKMLTKAWAEVQVPKKDLLVVSGIGCSSRLPYYTDAYGFHTLHGRGPTVAIGAKMINPQLSVWLITGDGDALSIGGNHFLHLIRRNADIKLLLFNNEIYGLTKGQASPTSKRGLKTKSTPFGAIDRPMLPLPLALTAGATFVARTVDADASHMKEVFKVAATHRGTAIIEILTNCIIFNDGTFSPYEKKDTRPDATIKLVDGQPLRFGKASEKGIILDGFNLRPVDLKKQPEMENQLIIHRTGHEAEGLQSLLARMTFPDMPLATGILRQVNETVYEDAVAQVESSALATKGKPDLDRLLRGKETWTQ